MKNYLFPRYFQIAGWILFIPSLITGVLLLLNIIGFSGLRK